MDHFIENLIMIQEFEEAEFEKISVDDLRWITAQGKKIPVREMSTLHIQNCIKCWNGKGKTKVPAEYLGGKKKWLKIFNDELLKRQ